MATTQPIRDKQQVHALAEYFLHNGQLRNHVLLMLGVHTALRISDLLCLKWDDVYDFNRRCIKTQFEITEKKTGKSKTIVLNKKVAKALSTLATEHTASKGRFIIENNRTGKAISRIQAYRIIRTAAETLMIETRVSCHSLRKTFGYFAWKSGISPVIIMEVYNHSSISITKRYLGVTQDDINCCYNKLAFLT